MPAPNTDRSTLYSGSRVLITGGLGFIGSNLALRLLKLGAGVTLVDNLHPNHGGNLSNIAQVSDQLHTVHGDCSDADTIRPLVQGQDFVFSLAGQTSHTDSMSDPEGDIRANCSAPAAVLDACRHLNPGARIVYTSTRQVYGVPQRLPVDEHHPLAPVDVNGCNKLAAEHYHQVYRHAYGLRTSNLRLTNTYGPRMRIKDARQNFLGFWIGELLSGTRIQVFGDGEQKRDFNFVDDVVDALLLCGTSESAIGEVINLGGDGPRPLREVADVLCHAAGSDAAVFRPFPAERKIIDIGHYWADANKAATLLGWRPRVSLEQGLALTLDYFKTQLRQYRP